MGFLSGHLEALESRALLSAVSGTEAGDASPSVQSSPPSLYGPDKSFTSTDHIVSATVFTWFRATSGQQSGPWRPEEGRENWTGDVDFWERQIKDMLDANIDLMLVIEIPDSDQQRVNLFAAANALRAQGYDVPKIAPFFDPVITFDIDPPIDVATTAGKDTWVQQYERFFDQYYSVNTDPYANDYLGQMDGKPILDVWHNLPDDVANLYALTRDDVESRLKSYYGADSFFKNGIYQIGTGINPWYPGFTDERLAQFEITDYYYPKTYKGITTAQVKAGYWDQNVRNPGSILKRDGGSHYIDAWNTINQNSAITHVNVESWNEYDEGSGIYAADPGAPYILPGSGNTQTDVWSSTNNPREYIDDTAAGARVFNSTPDFDSDFLWNNLPSTMQPGETRTVSVTVRNTGDVQWAGANGFKLGQEELKDPAVFGAGRWQVDDVANEVDKYGGVFRGRPVTFTFDITAPKQEGVYPLHYKMVQENVQWFGEELPWTITVKSADSIGADRGGKFYLDTTANYVWNSPSGGDDLFGFGSAGDTPVVGDWNHDAKDQLGVYRNAQFFLDVNGNGKWDGAIVGGDAVFSFGTAGDKPVIGDWNGDGTDDVGVFRNGSWYLDANGNHRWDGTAGGDLFFKFGLAGDTPVAGDWNSDGKDEVGVFRGGKWYLDADGDHAWNGAKDQYASFGIAGDKPIVGDWNADGKDDIGVVRSGKWYLDYNGNHAWNGAGGGDKYFAYGNGTDVPLAGHWGPTSAFNTGTSVSGGMVSTGETNDGGVLASPWEKMVVATPVKKDEGEVQPVVSVPALVLEGERGKSGASQVGTSDELLAWQDRLPI